MSYILNATKTKNIRSVLEKNPQMELYTTNAADLPYPFIPATKEFFNEQFYWDSYFILQGVDDLDIWKNMIENMFVLIKRFGYVPNSHQSYTTRSQPPFLSSLIVEYYAKTKDKEWLAYAFPFLQVEYSFWMKSRIHSCGLNMYMDNHDQHNVIRDPSYGAMQECGWDQTLRYGGVVSEDGTYVENSQAHLCCSLDLNCLLFKTEKDLAAIAKILGKPFKSYSLKARKRKVLIQKLMWNEEQGWFGDYHVVKKRILRRRSLASYYPLWVKLASKKQAEYMREHIRFFERNKGLATTGPKHGNTHIQWGFPNGWAPLHWITIMGLENYGYHHDAERVTVKWLDNCAKKFLTTKQWGEKLSVTKERRHDDARYPHQQWTGWTIGIFYALARYYGLRTVSK